MADTTAAKRIERPYKPSLIDHFKYWVERLPVSPWIFYCVLAIVLIMVQMLFLWLDGGYQAEVILPVVIFNASLVPIALGLIHLLDNQALIALNTMKPVLDTTEAEFDQYRYRLSNMPSWSWLMVFGLIMVIVLVLTELFFTVPVRYVALNQMPVFAVVYHALDVLTAFLWGVFFYHTVRQLRLVNTITSKRIRINLFNLGPLKTFSRVTAITAVGLVFGVYGWMLINPDLIMDLVNVGLVVVFTIMAVAVFVMPLYSVHRLMEKEKDKELYEIDLRFQAVFSKFNKGFRDDDHSALERLNGTIASLEIQRNRVEAIRTWPWKPETGRIALTMIAIPLIMTIIRFIIDLALVW